ncbi:MAG: PAS domain-containing protein [Minwuia sp.]|nr:PAS domain-containing protein [Minwuia sp.]
MNCEDETLQAIYRYWDEKRAGRRFPARADLDPADLVPYLGNISMIDVEYDPFRLRYRLVGTRITTMMRRDATGHYYDELYPPELMESIYDIYHWMIENGRPMRTFGEPVFADLSHYLHEAINLPLSDDGKTINKFMGALALHPKVRATP